jgi:hypothetical protein
VKRQETGEAAQLLQEYLDHVEMWLSKAAPAGEESLVVLDVMQYRKRVGRIVKRPVTAPIAPAGR